MCLGGIHEWSGPDICSRKCKWKWSGQPPRRDTFPSSRRVLVCKKANPALPDLPIFIFANVDQKRTRREPLSPVYLICVLVGAQPQGLQFAASKAVFEHDWDPGVCTVD